MPPRYNAAPSQELWVIRRNPETGEASMDLLKWGLIPYWCKERPKPPPINAKPMSMWPISTRVNSPKNDDAQLLEAIELGD
jgi:putative SOS response-associated peptidase YedK